MGQHLLYAEEYQVYPGDYAPIVNEMNIGEELKIADGNDEAHLPVNIFELDDLLKIELAVPGVKREDFLIHAGGNTLFVYLLRRGDEQHEEGTASPDNVAYEYFERQIILPDNADAEFVSAEYKEDILRLHIPKTNQPQKNTHTRIVVY